MLTSSTWYFDWLALKLLMIFVIDGVSGPLSNSQSTSLTGAELVPALEDAGLDATAAELDAGAGAVDAAAGAAELAAGVLPVLGLLALDAADLELLHAATPKINATVPRASARLRKTPGGLPGVGGTAFDLIITSVSRTLYNVKRAVSDGILRVECNVVKALPTSFSTYLTRPF
jgi:hypothetical protein